MPSRSATAESGALSLQLSRHVIRYRPWMRVAVERTARLRPRGQSRSTESSTSADYPTLSCTPKRTDFWGRVDWRSGSAAPQGSSRHFDYPEPARQTGRSAPHCHTRYRRRSTRAPITRPLRRQRESLPPQEPIGDYSSRCTPSLVPARHDADAINHSIVRLNSLDPHPVSRRDLVDQRLGAEPEARRRGTGYLVAV
jgi:hypothetical protein